MLSSLLPVSMSFASNSEHESIKQVLSSFSKAYRTKDITLLDSIFAEEVTYLGGDSKSGITDRSYLFEKGFGPVMDEKNAIEMDFKPTKIHSSQSDGYVAGYFRYFQKKEDGGDYFYGKFAMFLIKDQDKHWKITLDMHNLCLKESWDSAPSEIVK